MNKLKFEILAVCDLEDSAQIVLSKASNGDYILAKRVEVQTGNRVRHFYEKDTWAIPESQKDNFKQFCEEIIKNL